jgi:hypothetical protein
MVLYVCQKMAEYVQCLDGFIAQEKPKLQAGMLWWGGVIGSAMAQISNTHKSKG